MTHPSNVLEAPSASASDTDPDGASLGLRLSVIPALYGISRLQSRARIPRWVHRSQFYSVSRSPDELSILSEQSLVPSGVRCERDWRGIRVLGTLDFSLIGVLESLARPLAEAGIGLFTVSTFDTDYLFVRSQELARAIAALEAAGHGFEEPSLLADPPEKSDHEKSDHEESEHEKSDQEESADRARSTERQRAEKSHTAAEPRETRRREADSDDDSEVRHEETFEAASEEASEEASDDEDRPSRRSRSRDRSRTSRGSLAGSGPLGSLAPRPDDEPRTEETRERKSRAEERRTDDDRSSRRRSDTMIVPPVIVPSTSSIADQADDEEERGEEDRDQVARQARRRPSDSDDSLPADERQPYDEDDEDGAEGLFTGAIPQDPVETTDDTFESLGLSPGIIATLDSIGFEHPTPIQAGVLPMALEGSDILGLAETGSGKTGAFGLPMAERLTHGKGIRGLILCPTREIALQTKAFLDIFGRDHALETAVIIGGVKFQPQISALRRKPDIIVATPGRLADHMRRRNVSLRDLEELVLDEADHMLDLGFLPQIQEIVDQVPEDRRTMMFSATMPPLIERLAQRFLDDPYVVDLRPVNRVAAGIAHRLYLVSRGDEKKCLVRLLEEEGGSTLVFARRKLDTEFLARQLELAGLPVDRIHSDRSQSQRVRALRGFREGKTRILVATDVAARGIDVPRLSHVINFGLPDSVEDYIHRAGRTARGKAVGTVSTIGTWQDKLAIREVERILGHPIERCTVEGVEPYREMPKRRKTVRRRRLL